MEEIIKKIYKEMQASNTTVQQLVQVLHAADFDSASTDTPVTISTTTSTTLVEPTITVGPTTTAATTGGTVLKMSLES